MISRETWELQPGSLSLVHGLEDETRSLQKVGPDLGANNFDRGFVAGFGELNLDVFAETRRVVVPGRLGVTKGLKIDPKRIPKKGKDTRFVDETRSRANDLGAPR